MSLGEWSECAPHQVGMRDAEVGQAVELVRAYGGIAQLCVLRHGQVVLDRQIRCNPQALFWLFSASKPLIAAAAGRLGDRAQAWIWNRRRVRQAVIPAAGVSTTARDLARFYQMMLDGGRLDGASVMAPDTITEATRASSGGEIDRTRGWPVRYAHGFQLGSPGRQTGMGRMAGAQTFGHAEPPDADKLPYRDVS